LKFEQIYNLGTGEGVSVMRLLRTFEKVTNTTVPFELLERRLGDIDAIFAKCELAEKDLGWKSKFSLEQMCKFSEKKPKHLVIKYS
jgi:UDP-glucose 4-epimerase